MARTKILDRIMIPIIKVVGDICNLQCTYCFHNDKSQRIYQIMEEKLLEKFIAEYLEFFSGRLNFIWHGGEPLLAGLDFFEKVIELQKKYGKKHKISNLIQTNGTLINETWAKFLKSKDFRVGISLDGDCKSHNRFRKQKNGKGLFDLVMHGIKILRRYNIKPGFIQTLTHDNASLVQKNFHFFVKVLKIKSWGVNHYLDIKNRRMADQTITNDDLILFLKTSIDIWLLENDPNLQLREIDDFLAGIFGKQASSCTFNGTCARHFCIEPDGQVYPCDRLSGYKELLFGNLSHQSLSDILNSSARWEYVKKVKTIPSECLLCEWQDFCNNGCAHHRLPDIGSKYYYCETRKTIFQYLKEKINLEKEVKNQDGITDH